MNSKVSIVKCKDYDPSSVEKAVRDAIDLAGGITSFIKPQSCVLVKPNLLMAKAPASGITTHPEVVRAVIKVLKQIDCKIFVGDDPNIRNCLTEEIGQIYEATGIKKVCEEESAILVDFNKKRWRGAFPLTTWLDECDYLVNVPKFKTHNLTTLTGAIKNLFGLVSGTYKAELHKDHFEADKFAKVLVDVLELTKPSLTVIDGIIAMEANGPVMNGKLRNLGLLFAGSDCVALDAVLAQVMGLEPSSILTTKEAAKRGLGVADIDSISVAGEKLKDLAVEPFLLPKPSIKRSLPPKISSIISRQVFFYPGIIDKYCLLCGECFSVCPNGAILPKENRVTIDYHKCRHCFCCSGSCPNSAIKVRRSFFARLAGL